MGALTFISFSLNDVGKSGLQSEISPDITPREAFQQFVTDEVFEHIANETNRFAAQSRSSDNLPKKLSKKHRLSQ